MNVGQNVVGKNVASLRNSVGLTQETFTAKLNLVGWSISRATLGKIESGVRRVNDAEVLLFSRALKCSYDDLFLEISDETAAQLARHGDQGG